MHDMTNTSRILAAALLCAVSIPSLASVASAMPIADGMALRNAAPAAVETVQWRRGWRGGGGGWGWRGAGAGFVAGAIIGGALAAPYYGYGYGYPGPYYAGPPVVYGPPAAVYGGPAPMAGDPTAYCMQRFRSYDPGSGTYLGYDQMRHPCP
jgi:BA14K-like protein